MTPRRNRFRPRYYKTKYGNHERVKMGGRNVRKLTDDEIAEFRAHIQRLIDPSLRVPPIMRRAIV